MSRAVLLAAALVSSLFIGHLTAEGGPRFRAGSQTNLNSTNVPGGWSTNSPACTNGAPDLTTNAAVTLAAKAAVLYAAVEPFDTNSSGTLESGEQEALATALTEGTVALFGTNHPAMFRTQEVTNVAAWAASLYAVLAGFDADQNGIIDANEQTALAAALEADTVSLPLFAPLYFGHSARGAVGSRRQLRPSTE
jgi:hypothetical protein